MVPARQSDNTGLAYRQTLPKQTLKGFCSQVCRREGCQIARGGPSEPFMDNPLALLLEWDATGLQNGGPQGEAQLGTFIWAWQHCFTV